MDYVIPFVAAGGLLITIGFAIGGPRPGPPATGRSQASP
jgi:fructose-specific phosphotransferase system IIC component